MKGKVKWFNFTKGYGFIQPEDGSKDVFVHHTALPQENGRAIRLDEGDEVEFEIEQGEKGPNAVKVKLLSKQTGSSKEYDEPNEEEII